MTLSNLSWRKETCFFNIQSAMLTNIRLGLSIFKSSKANMDAELYDCNTRTSERCKMVSVYTS